MWSCTPGAYEQQLAALSAEEQAKVVAEEAAPSPKPAEWEKAHQWETWVGWRLSDRYPPLRMILVWDASFRSSQFQADAVALRPRHHAALYAAWWVLVEHG